MYEAGVYILEVTEVTGTVIITLLTILIVSDIAMYLEWRKRP